MPRCAIAPVQDPPAAPPRPKHGHALARFVSDQRGVTAIEFAILAVPFFAIIAAILQTAVMFLAAQFLDGAVHDTSRLLSTGQAQSNSFDHAWYKRTVCDHLYGLFDCNGLRIKVSVVSDFASASVAPPIDSGAQWVIDESYRPGTGNSIVMVQAYYKWPMLFGFSGLDSNALSDGTRLLGAVRVFRNEPFS